MYISLNQQCYSEKDLERLSRPQASWQQRFIQLQSGDNQNAICCGGKAVEQSCSISTDPMHGTVPLQLLPPTGGIDKLTQMRLISEDPEVRKVRLTSGVKCKSLLNDALAEPLPPRIRRPGEGKLHSRRKSERKLIKTWQPPLNRTKKQKDLDKSLDHLPFFGSCRYDRMKLLKQVTEVRPLRGMINYGRYYIEKDWKNYIDPRTDPDTLLNLLVLDSRKRRKFRSSGPVYRIVELFMEKVFDWSLSKEMLDRNVSSKKSSIALLWLGPCLAKKMLNELCIVNDPSRSYMLAGTRSVDEDFYLINRLAIDVFFSDKEAFYYMLKGYVLSPSLTCKTQPSEMRFCGDNANVSCLDLEANRSVTRRICVHQNLSLSLKPCLVPNCPNYKLPVCEHLYAFIPETITINSYVSMLHFIERFHRVEDLKGTIFITKPAYLCNGRGINFLVDVKQFECFYHMLDGKSTSRHGVILQRYIECPRLFDHSKFTIRFFLLIIVLPRRRVIGFIHYGLAIFCLLPYQQVNREDFPPEEEALEGKEPNLKIPIANRTVGRVLTERFSRQSHLSNYRDPNVLTMIKEEIKYGRASMMEMDEDNVFYIEDVLPAKCLNSKSIYIQMLFASQCIMDYMQPVVQDYPGTFQTVSIDSLVDARNKLWILEAGTKIFSGLLTVAPRQRQIMSSIIQESLGITVECFYKSLMGLPLYWDYNNACEDYDAFYFAQDFNFFYETDVNKQTSEPEVQRQLRAPRLPPPPPPGKKLEDRYREVDDMRQLARRRKLENARRKREVVAQRLAYINRLKQKTSEES
uniref:DNA-directed RNA polymerase n=1 Tax=Macrostomum lignano TaxID=282301 RepID=A0A1I8GSI8_9PLAT